MGISGVVFVLVRVRDDAFGRQSSVSAARTWSCRRTGYGRWLRARRWYPTVRLRRRIRLFLLPRRALVLGLVLLVALSDVGRRGRPIAPPSGPSAILLPPGLRAGAIRTRRPVRGVVPRVLLCTLLLISVLCGIGGAAPTSLSTRTRIIAGTTMPVVRPRTPGVASPTVGIDVV